MSRRERLLRLLASPRLPLLAAALGAVLTLPSLWAGLATEDWVFRALARSPLTLSNLNFFGGPRDPAFLQSGRDLGWLPWLTSENWHIAFFRPLASLTHQLDFRLLGRAVWLMHLENVVWYALGVWLAARLYRRWLGPTAVAGVAALLYAVDDAHGHAVGWLANRNALMATVFGLAALEAHQRWRSERWRPGALLAPLWLALALLSGEHALGVLGYFVAHALFLEAAPPRTRVLALVPAATVTAAWAALHHGLGYGATGSGISLDPLRDPLGFLGVLPDRVGALLFGQLAGVPTETWVELGDDRRFLLAVGGGLALSALALLTRWLWRRASDADAAARPKLAFFALGAVLALIAAATTFPSDRMLHLAGVGAMGALGQLAFRLQSVSAAGAGASGQRLALVALIAVHGVVAPALLPLRTHTMAGYHAEALGASVSAFSSVGGTDEILVVVNAPDYYFCSLLLLLQYHALDRPASPQICLAGSLAPVELTRLDDHALEVRTRDGFLDRAFDRIYRDPRDAMRVGERRATPTVQIEITEVTASGVPKAAKFRFVRPLDGGKLRFVAFRDGRYQPLAPLVVGERVVVKR